MKLDELKKEKSLLFIDIETISKKDIVQIGITKWCNETRQLEVVFNQIVNPKVEQHEINRFAESVHFVSEYQWAKANTVREYYSELSSSLKDSVVLHWGGQDCKILNDTFDYFGLDLIPYRSVNLFDFFFEQKRLIDAASEIGIKNNAFHDASFDSFVTGVLFAVHHFDYEISPTNHALMKKYDDDFKSHHKEFRVTKIKQGSGKSGEVCLTGFKKGEKLKIAETLADLGFRIRENVTKDLDYLIVPSGDYKRSPSKEKKAIDGGAKIIQYDDFKNFINKNVA
ncbi:hypothetical protein [Halobacteriovorax sp. ZH4_bin.1]|uniref:hypothetical protein n=1 Tax=unclassified Halobacteriovorax TaxID=2639665 RepID=UPI003711DE49